MGGQPFGTDSVLLDTTGLDAVIEFDSERGEIEVGAGIQWPELIDHLVRVQADSARSWGIIQKQTGADRLCMGGRSRRTHTAAGGCPSHGPDDATRALGPRSPRG